MKTSVAICTYNGGQFLKEQLESVLEQSVQPDEIVICDDQSTDTTLEILAEYQKKHPEIFKIYKNQSSLGIIKNFEKAINLCQNDIVFLCDQDDLWNLDKVETVLHYFKNNPEQKAVFHDLTLLENSTTLEYSNWDTLFLNPQNTDGISILHYLILFGNVATGASFAFKNEKNKWDFNSSSQLFLHDYQLAVHFAAENTLGLINEKLGAYRIHASQQIGTSENNRQKRKDIYDRFINSSALEKLRFYEEKSKNWQNRLNADDAKKIMQFIQKEMDLLKSKHLKNQPFIQRSCTRFYWEISKKFKIN